MGDLWEEWTYDRNKSLDGKGKQWHFARYVTWYGDEGILYEGKYAERSYALYFRDDAREIFGVVKYPRWRDNPYWEDKLKDKIMNDVKFREEYIDPKTQKIWKRSWK